MTKQKDNQSLKTHWKKNFNYNYLGSYSLLDNQEATLTIRKVVKESVSTQNGSKEDCTVAYFKESVNGENKPMILNKTNCKTIEKIYHTPYIEEWVNKKIIVYVEQGVKAFGDIVDALRVRPKVPKAKALMTLDHKRFEDAKLAWNSGKQEGVKKQFVITEEIEKAFES